MAAVREECLPVFELLAECGWDVNGPVIAGQTALSALVKNEAQFKRFFKHGAEPSLGLPSSTQSDSAPIPNSDLTLNCAASVATLEVLDVLLQYGAKLEN